MQCRADSGLPWKFFPPMPLCGLFPPSHPCQSRSAGISQLRRESHPNPPSANCCHGSGWRRWEVTDGKGSAMESCSLSSPAFHLPASDESRERWPGTSAALGSVREHRESARRQSCRCSRCCTGALGHGNSWETSPGGLESPSGQLGTHWDGWKTSLEGAGSLY